MPQKRQSIKPQHVRPELPPLREESIIVRSLGLRLPPGHRIEPHAHDWNQLVYATEGVMTVSTPAGTWVVPPNRAVWIPSGFEHEVKMTGTVMMRTIYIRADLTDRMPGTCNVVNVSPLLRELILAVNRAGMLTDDVPEQARLSAVLLDQMMHTREAPLRIGLPSDHRARKVAGIVLADLSVTKPVAELARGSGASTRTIERLFVKETGLTFGRWLRRARILHALERLAAGDSVTEAGLAVGYESTSAFIAMFKRTLGTTPAKYFQDSFEQSGTPWRDRSSV